MAYQRIIDTLMIVLDRLTNCSIHKELPIQYDMQLSVEIDGRQGCVGLIVFGSKLVSVTQACQHEMFRLDFQGERGDGEWCS